MSYTSIEATIIVTAIVLWFAHGWYLNTRLQQVHEKLDRLLEAFEGLRSYLYEIDPQFDDERHLLGELHDTIDSASPSFAGMNHMELIKRKKEQGRRTLGSPL